MTSIWVSDEGRAAVHDRYAELLARWPVPSEHRTLQTREGETFVVVCGPADGPPVLLLQGSGANAAMWLRDIAVLAARFRVYAVDLIGEPGFSAPSRPPLKSDRYASWADDVMDALGLASASLVGVSLGGWIALDYATRRSDRVNKVVAINPGGVGRQRSSFMFKAAMLMLLGKSGRRKAMLLAIGPAPGEPHPLDRDVGMLAMLISKHFRRRREIVPVLTDESLKRLTMPTMAILGSQDALIDARHSRERLTHHAPRATVRWLEDTGHLVRNQTPAVLEFLET